MEEKERLLAGISDRIHNCENCRLCRQRRHAVPGEGNPNAVILFVGEGPGADEDASGRPFVGRAGQLLERMLAAIDLRREDVFIANVVKCRPPNNRTPSPDEVSACLPFLRQQVYALKPKIIVCLGSPAAKALINPDLQITRDRGLWIERKGYLMTATLHPAYLLRDESKKGLAWEDFKKIRERYDEIVNHTQEAVDADG